MASDFPAGESQDHARRPGPLLSILVPIYNVAPWLEECVNSILSQHTGDDVELILLDDASTDGSLALAQMLADRHPGRVILMAHEVNEGLSAARNSMLGRARGRHVWFVDSDDMVMDGALPTLLDILRRHDPDVVICDYSKNGARDVSAFAGKAWTLDHDRDALLRGVFQRRQLHAWLRISRRALWGSDLRFPIGRVFEDVATTPALMLRARSYYHVPRPFIFYRWRPGSILSSVRGGRFDQRKHDDFVYALSGLKEDMAARLPEASMETRFRISYFIEKEFSKVGYRLLKSAIKQPDLRPVDATIRRYYHAFGQSSPIAFRQLPAMYWRRGDIFRWMVLRYFLSRVGSPEMPVARAA
ncbi:MAG: glycosyltransferase family 2 protein [Sphingobium sp.]